MKCKNLIILTGISCVGKTTIAVELRKRFGYHIIHTDGFYHPLKGKGLGCNAGDENKEKNELIREQKPLMTETTIIEGSHVGNTKELEIFKRELGFNGNVYTFKVNSSNFEEQFKSKHKEDTENIYNGISKWFNKIYDLRNAVIIESAEDLINFLEIKDGNICISG